MMEITRATDALKSTINTVDADITDILQSGNYYCTEEIARELYAIRNGLEHLKLDSTLLGSSEWQKSFNPRYTASSLAGATSVLDKAAARLFDYKSQLGAVPTGQKEENDIREAHQWAMTTLKQIQEDMAPYTYGATNRIKQFGDHIGVTDRYTGYRNNLTRGSQEPFKMETSWMDKGCKTGYMNPLSQSQTSFGFPGETRAQRPQLLSSKWEGVPPDDIGSLHKEIRFSNDRAPMTIYRGYRTIDSLYPRSNTFTAPGLRAGGGPNFSEHIDNMRFLNSMNATLASKPGENNQEHFLNSKNGTLASHPEENNQETVTPKAVGTAKMSVPEQTGINTTFPGRTEYMQRYTSPTNTSSYNDFLINPKPDMTIYGQQLEAHYEPNCTEYQTRYEWPDGNKICKCPWTRK